MQRSLNDREHPRPGPHDYQSAADDNTGANARQRLNRFVQKLARTRIDLNDVREHLSAGGEAIAEGEQQQQGREQGHQSEVAHGRGRGEQVVFVELMQGVTEHAPPRRAIAHPKRMT